MLNLLGIRIVCIQGVIMKKFVKILTLVVLALTFALGMVACSDNTNGGSNDKGLIGKRQGDTWVISKFVDDGTTNLDIGEKLELVLPDGVSKVKIKANAFSGNGTLKKVTVPASVVEIEAGAFAKMSKLEELVLPFVGEVRNADVWNQETDQAPDSEKAINAERTIAHIFGTEEYDEGSEVTIYYDSTSSTKCYIPETLYKIQIVGTDNYKVPMYAFCGLTSISEIVLTGSVSEIGRYAFSKSGVRVIEIPESVTRIHDGAFESSRVQQVLFSAGVANGSVEIMDNAFRNCTLVKYIGEKVNTMPTNTINLAKFKFTSNFGVVDAQGNPVAQKAVGKNAFEFNNSTKYAVLGAGTNDLVKLFGEQEYNA
ncbi:MAG: hypothetical protein E7347_00465 [Clostridiales bacterium]|nr:hypothetical protein [Clostridiales bacterium]